MAHTPRYRRVLVKVSGESLSSSGGGVDAPALSALADELEAVRQMGVQIGVVVGGGNFLRGRELADNPHIQRVTSDHMGMLATVMNALALRDTLAARSTQACAMSGIPMPTVCEPFVQRKAVGALEDGAVLILAGGTGSPFFTTDTCAALRACEIGAEALLKATKVDGVFDSDPVANPDAMRYDRLSYQEFIAQRLGVMDLTAVSLCMENKLPIIVFQLSKKGNLARVICGEDVGTVVS